MSIIERAELKTKDIADHPDEGAKNADRAVKAIIGGINSPAWKTYMLSYADNNTPELDRLMATDGTLGDLDLDTKRAYLVGNAVCGEPTKNDLTRLVNTIDLNLQGCK